MTLTIKTRLGSVIAFLSILAAGIGVLGLHGMQLANQGLQDVYENRALMLERISRIDALLLQNRLSLAQAINDPMADIKAESARIERNAAEIDQAWRACLPAVSLPEERRLADRFGAAWTRMQDEGLRPAMAALRGGDVEAAKAAQEHMRQLAVEVVDDVRGLRRLQVDAARREYERAAARYTVLRNSAAAAIALGTLAAALFGSCLIRHIYRDLGGEPAYAAAIVRRIAAGDLRSSCSVTRPSALGDDGSDAPSTIRSQPCCTAVSRMASAGLPSATWMVRSAISWRRSRRICRSTRIGLEYPCRHDGWLIGDNSSSAGHDCTCTTCSGTCHCCASCAARSRARSPWLRRSVASSIFCGGARLEAIAVMRALRGPCRLT